MATKAGIAPFRVMFPAAAALAAAVVPLWTLGWLGHLPLWQGAFLWRWHGHEMIFGFALALMAGYLVARRSTAVSLALLAAWLCGRVAGAGLLPPPAGALLALAYPAALVSLAAPPFLRAAKSPDNLLFAPLLGAFLAAEVLFQLEQLGLLAEGGTRGLLLGGDLVALMLFAMGGRIIAAASSGALQRQGLHLPGMAQVPADRIGVIALLTAVLADQAGAMALAGVAQLAAAGAAGRKLLAWRVWRVWRSPEVFTLHLGYGWLALGLAIAGIARLTGWPPPLEATHAWIVGGLGTLSVAVMARTRLQRLRASVVMTPILRFAVGFVSVAAMLRLASMLPGMTPLMLVAAAAWMAAWILVLLWLIRPAGRSVERPRR
jgi:uncharacterized protein involved in response to NO